MNNRKKTAYTFWLSIIFLAILVSYFILSGVCNQKISFVPASESPIIDYGTFSPTGGVTKVDEYYTYYAKGVRGKYERKFKTQSDAKDYCLQEKLGL